MVSWHALSTEEVLRRVESTPGGLSRAESARRLRRDGENLLRQERTVPLWLRFFAQMKDPMILVLLGAAALSMLASGGEDWLDAAIILLIVVVNSLLSVFQEDNARKALEALQNMTAPHTRVLREGSVVTLPAREVVVGDVLVLEAGDGVPADARILEGTGLQADESALTGESLPVGKGMGPALPEETVLAERSNLLLTGTLLTAGRGKAVVVAVGMDTEVGQIAGLLLHQGEGETPLQRKMDEISKTLSFVCLCVCAVLFGVGLLEGRPLLSMFLTAVSLDRKSVV